MLCSPVSVEAGPSNCTNKRCTTFFYEAIDLRFTFNKLEAAAEGQDPRPQPHVHWTQLLSEARERWLKLIAEPPKDKTGDVA